MRTNAWLVALGLTAAGLSACGGSAQSDRSAGASSGSQSTASCSPASNAGGPYCLHFVGTAYTVHIGQLFKLALVSADGNNTVIASARIDALPAAAFTLDMPRSMVDGVPYYVDYFADESSNGSCDPPPTDHVWRSHTEIDFYTGVVTTVTASGGDVTWNAPHDDPWVTDPASMNTCAQLNQVP